MTKANFNKDDDFNFNNDDTHCECKINYGFTHVSFVRNSISISIIGYRIEGYVSL